MTVVLTQSDWAKGYKAMPQPAEGGDVAAQRVTVTIPATAALNDIFELCPIPPGCEPVQFIFDSDDLDSNVSPTLTIDVGLMSGTPGDNDITRTVGTEILSAATLGQAQGVATPTLKGAYRIGASDAVRALGLKIHAAANTAAAGTFGMTIIYKAA